jgi:hypothetical protein
MLKRVAPAVKILARVAAVLSGLAGVACGGGKDAPTAVIGKPVVLPPTLVASTSQVVDGMLNSVLPVMPSAALRDVNGSGIANVWVKWTPSTGTVESDSTLTDVNGRASAGKWTLGTVSGMQTVTARANGVSVVALTANIAPGPMASLVPVSSTLTGVVGSNVSTPASVKAVDAYGNAVAGTFVQFAMWEGDGSVTGTAQTTGENGIATVGSWKLGPKTGAQSIRADDHRTGATTLVRATALPAPASQFVIIDGNAQTGQADKRLCTSPLVAVRDQFGNGIGGVPIIFTPGVGSGMVTDASSTSSVGTGYATVGAWTLSGNATQTLTATVAPSAVFAVCVRYVGDGGTPRVRQAVTNAVQRWQRVIVGHVQTSPLSEPANRCFVGEPAINEVVEDLLVFVQVTYIDGPGTRVARAGPCTVHMPTGLTQMGLLQIDSADVELLLGQGTLDNMITHEFGHVLGFGTLWTTRRLLSGSGTSDPVFTGTSARAQFARLFPSYAGNAVPIENTGDIGTRDTHWRRGVFNNELMQGFSSAIMPLSAVTVGAMGDIGYTVDVSKADPFAFGLTSTTTALRAESLRSADLANDVAETDVWGVEKNGRRSLVRVARNPFKQQ